MADAIGSVSWAGAWSDRRYSRGVRFSARLRFWSLLVTLSVSATACAGVGVGEVTVAAADEASVVTSTASTTTESTTTIAPTTTAAPTTTVAPATTSAPTTTAAPVATVGVADRVVANVEWGTPFAVAIDLTLYYPAVRVERIGFHEAGRDGSRQMDPLPEATRPITMETRNRGTGSRTAADVVVDPTAELRSPVTGTVIRSGTYVLYCKYTDDFVVIDPDDHPGWEVKMFHFQGLSVKPGDRVEAGVTVVGSNSAYLPFESQVNEFTAEPSWPHVHIEVIDPSIPNRPHPGGGC